MTEEVEAKEEREPWIWKAAIVALPLGLALSAAIAVGLKISKGEKTGMEGVRFSAKAFEVANLRDAAGKIDDLIGARDFETKEGQRGMQQMTALIEGSLSAINLGYQVEKDRGVAVGGRLWKNYWIDGNKKSTDGSVFVWVNYAEADDSASVAALLSVAEWLRGREFQRRVRLAFVRDNESVSSARAGLGERNAEIQIQVSRLGQGSSGFQLIGGPVEGSREVERYQFTAQERSQSNSDWKLTTSWEQFENQVRSLCEEVSERAGERVVFKKGAIN